MSSKIEILQGQMAETVDQAGGVESAVGSAALIEMLVLILMDMFQNCGGAQRAKAQIKRPKSLLTRAAMRKAGNQLARERDPDLSYKDRQRLTSAAISTLNAADEATLDAVLGEAKDVMKHTLI